MQAQVVDLARALLDGGLNVVEVTLRTAAALESVSAIKASLPEMIVGAGTVNTVDQVGRAVAAGADFLVSPGATAGLLESAGDCGIPWLPGASTPSEVMRLRDIGYRVQKFFPAEVSGGVAKLKAMYAPLPDVMFCPTGGITQENAAEYLALPNVAFVGGTWLTTDELVRKQKWDEISAFAREAAALG